MLFKSAGIIARFDEKKATTLAVDLVKHLTTKGIKVYVEDSLNLETESKHEVVPLEEMKADFLITIGGDGTILRTCVSIPKPEPPILAVNMGVRGFLTEVEATQAHNAIDRCLKGRFKLEKCMKLASKIGRHMLPDSLNEVLITADEKAKLLYSRIIKDEELILDCQADAIMVSTQTGSTGYSLSAGGPVLDPRVDAFVLTPVCALSVVRSIVIPADSTLRIDVLRPKRTLVIVDGQRREAVDSKFAELTVTRSKHTTSFFRFEEDFYKRLRSRLFFRGLEKNDG